MELMHRVAAMYPSRDDVSKEDRTNMIKMVNGLARHFPCKECAEHFQYEIKVVPPKVNDNKEFAKWFCYQHNQVNKRIGKEVQNCEDMQKIINDFKL